jgi:hypothetical protein
VNIRAEAALHHDELLAAVLHFSGVLWLIFLKNLVFRVYIMQQKFPHSPPPNFFLVCGCVFVCVCVCVCVRERERERERERCLEHCNSTYNDAICLHLCTTLWFQMGAAFGVLGDCSKTKETDGHSW